MDENITVIYIDSDFRCYADPGEGRRAVEAEAFADIPPSEIERYRFVPEGEAWTREDGETFYGGMVSLIETPSELEDMRAALALMGVTALMKRYEVNTDDED